MKWISPAVVLLLGLAVILLPPAPPPTPDAEPGRLQPPVAICATEEGGGRATDLAIASTIAGEGLVTMFSGGESVGTGRFETDESGTAVVQIGAIAAVGQAAAIVEFPASDSAASSISRGATTLSAETCARSPEPQTVVGAASTLEGSTLTVQLMNPYATEAIVDIAAFSESGRESAEALEGIIVPPRSSVIADIGIVLPGRESLALELTVVRGSVVPSVRADNAVESAVWRPTAPSDNWLLPFPSFAEGTRELVIVSTTAAEVAYQIDTYGPNGLEEAVLEGVVEGRGQQVIDVGALADGALAVRVVAEAPVGVFARYRTETGLGVGSASPEAASDWFLPGAGSVAAAPTTVAIANVGLESVEVAVTQLRTNSVTETLTIEPGDVVELTLDSVMSAGVALVSDGDIVPFWLARLGGAVAVSGGASLVNE